jgi:beta-lactamase superfamily II metal-dependent hydrolase
MFKKKEKRILPIIILGVILFVFSGSLWAQNLEIHYINVQQGQSTLIIGPNGVKILYDGGNEFKGTDEVVPYLQGLGMTTATSLDYMVSSHMHTDHYRGLTEVINYGYDFLTIYDNGSPYTNYFVQEFETAAATTTAGGVVAMPMGQVIDLGNGCTATCVAVDGSVIGTGPVNGGQDNENDRSVCLLIQYGDFDYLVTGDLGGGSDDYDCTGRSTSQINIESPLVYALMPAGSSPMLTSYGVEIAHVAHHGSESSTNSEYMNILTPAIAPISVGAGQSDGWFHPRIDVVENVLLAQAPCITAPPCLVLQTEEGAITGYKTSFAGYCVGDIIITTDGVNSYTISGTGAVSQGPDERVAAGLPATYYFEEYTAIDTAPSIYNAHEENVTQTSADIVWTTNESADSVVKYGTISGNYSNTISNGTLTYNHNISLTSLTAYTTYYYIIESTDATNNTTTTQEASFVAVNLEEINVVFSEVFYDTPGTDSEEEWIELYNNSPVPLDLGGWKITDNNGAGSSYTIPAGEVIEVGTYYTIAKSSTGFTNLYGYEADLYAYIPSMNNDGDVLILQDKSGTIKDFVAYEGGSTGGLPTGWGSSTEPSASTGSTIYRISPTSDSDTYSDWSVASNNGNPETQGMNEPSSQYVVFSEIFYDTPGTDSVEEWIELYNNSLFAVDIGGWKITDNNGIGTTFTIPTGETILPGTYYTIASNNTGFNNLYGYDADLYGSIPLLNNTGDTLLLKDGENNLKDQVAWEGGATGGIPLDWGSASQPSASTGNSIYRTDPTTDTDTYQDWSTFADNGFPQTQMVSFRVVMSEVLYDTPGTDSEEEWIELYNNSPVSVDIGGWKITDNNGTGGTYTIPDGETMAPGTYITIAANSTGFTNLYGYEADIYGSIPALNNDGDALLLKDSNGNVVDFVAWEGGASSGVPTGWGSASSPSASTGYTIVRSNPEADTNTYSDWTTASNNGNPQTQGTSVAKVVFSEIFYDTPGTDSVEEWIELYNNSTSSADIGGWTITDNNDAGVTYTMPAGQTIAAGAYYTIAVNSTGFTNIYGYAANIYGAIPSLNNTGDTLILKDGSSNVIDFVAWEGGATGGIPTGWGSTSLPSASTGNTIIRTSPTTDTDTYSDWTTASNNGNPQTQ